MTDERLIEAVQSGDTRAADMLVRRYDGLARAVASEFFLPGAERDDVRQEALLALLLAARQHKADGGLTFKSFAAMVIRRRLVSAVIEANRVKRGPLDKAARTVVLPESGERVSAVETIHTHDHEPERALEANETLTVIWTTMRSSFSLLEARAVIGTAIGMRYDELDGAKVTDNAVQRGLKKLRSALEDDLEAAA